MSESDSDFLAPSNVLSFPNTSSIVRIKGPNHDSNFNLNFNGNSSMMPSYFERQRVRNYEQRSMLGHREVSLAKSIRSVETSSNNFQRSFCHGGFAQSSTIYSRERRRCTSPASIISTGSNVSTAASIISAFKSGQLNNHELKSIKDALNKCFKGRVRKKISKRRNFKVYMKGARRKSGDDSGDLGSDSSVSSDDCKSTRTGITMRSNYSQYMNSFHHNKVSQNGRISDDAKSSTAECTNLRKIIKESTMYKDSSQSLKQNSFRNILSLGSRTMNGTLNNEAKDINKVSQKDRFKSNFLLPSQRFAKCSKVLPIPEDSGQNKPQSKTNDLQVETSNKPKQNLCNNAGRESTETDDDNIFFEISDPERSLLRQPSSNNKRCLNSSDESLVIKKTKLSSPQKMIQMKENKDNALNNNHPTDDVVFAKPLIPMRKSTKSKTIEKPSIMNPAEPKPSLKHNKPPISSTLNNDGEGDMSLEDHQSRTMLSDISSRPSFMKRKLFTQTLDLAEQKGNGNDSSPDISLQKPYDVAKEKNKTRKLVTNQSYLSRDPQREDDQLLDLIHKIVPPEHMNATANTTQKDDIHVQNKKTNNFKSLEAEDRWNITDIISTCNYDDVSDTYTDEEIFNIHNKESKDSKPRHNSESNNNKNISKPCSVVVEKINAKNLPQKTPLKLPIKSNQKNTKNVIDLAQAFWNMDSESETPQKNDTKFNNIDDLFAKRRQDHYVKKNNLNKNMKSLLDITETSDKSLSLDKSQVNAGKKINNNNLPVRDALKEKKTPLKSNMTKKNNNKTGASVINTDRIPAKKTNCGLQHQEIKKNSLTAGKAKINKPTNAIIEKENIRSENHIHETSGTNCTNGSSDLNNLSSMKRPRGRPRKDKQLNLLKTNISSDLDCSKILRSRTYNTDTSLDQDILNNSKKPKRNSKKERETIGIHDKITTKTDKANKSLEATTSNKKNVLQIPKIKAAAVSRNNIEPKQLNRQKKSLTVTQNVSSTKLSEAHNNSVSSRTRKYAANNSPIPTHNMYDTIKTRSSKDKKKSAATPSKITINKGRNILNSSNKENVNNRTKTRKSTRTVKKSSLCSCSDEKPSSKPSNYEVSKSNDQLLNRKELNAPKKKSTKIDDFLMPSASKARDVIPDSPKPSIISDQLETRRRKATASGTKDKSVIGTVKVWELGFARPTIGVQPPHGAAEQPRCDATLIDDDTNSVTVRSVTSLSTRSRRPRFLHVF